MSAILREPEPVVQFNTRRLFSLWRRWEREGVNCGKWYLVTISLESSSLLMAGLRGTVQWEVMHHEQGMAGMGLAVFEGFHDEPLGDGPVGK